jgi:CubicO group peptidase (beta-lactamase class C family)
MLEFTDTLRTTVERELRTANIPGGSVAVIDRKGDEDAFAVGFADLASQRRATPGTAYHLFSGTKLYTATAVLQLVECGVLSLDASAATHLPDILGTSRVTVRQLLNHTSGLRDTLRAFLAVHAEGTPAPDTASALARYRIRARRRPGERVEYRNVNYAILGELVTRVSGQPYAEYVAEHVLAPLGMAASFGVTEAMRPDLATGYLGAWEPLRFVAPWLLPQMRGRLLGARVGGLIEIRPLNLDTAAIGGLVGAAVSFLPFVRAHLTNGAPLLRESTRRQMQTLTARGAAGIMSRVGVGLGWKIGAVDGATFLNHEGGGPGFTSETRLYPSEGLGIVVCLNRWRAPTRSHIVAHRVCEAVRKELTGRE